MTSPHTAGDITEVRLTDTDSLLYTGQTRTEPAVAALRERRWRPGRGLLTARLPGEKSATSSREHCRPARGNSHQVRPPRADNADTGREQTGAPPPPPPPPPPPARHTTDNTANTHEYNSFTSQPEVGLEFERTIFRGLRCTTRYFWSLFFHDFTSIM